MSNIVNLEKLQPMVGSRKNSKRVGRGHGSGWGKTAGYGHKGQAARSGVPLGMEGGQTPLYRRLPKRGFNPRPHYAESVTLGTIEIAIGSGVLTKNITFQSLRDAKLIRPYTKKCKIIGNEISITGVTLDASVKISKGAEQALSKVK